MLRCTLLLSSTTATAKRDFQKEQQHIHNAQASDWHTSFCGIVGSYIWTMPQQKARDELGSSTHTYMLGMIMSFSWMQLEDWQTWRRCDQLQWPGSCSGCAERACNTCCSMGTSGDSSSSSRNCTVSSTTVCQRPHTSPGDGIFSCDGRMRWQKLVFCLHGLLVLYQKRGNTHVLGDLQVVAIFCCCHNNSKTCSNQENFFLGLVSCCICPDGVMVMGCWLRTRVALLLLRVCSVPHELPHQLLQNWSLHHYCSPPLGAAAFFFLPGLVLWPRITLIKRRHEIYQEPFFIASWAPCIVVSGTEMPLLSSSRNSRRPSSSQEQRRRPFLCPTAANKTNMQKIFSFCEIMCLLLEEDCKTFCILKFFFFFTRSRPVLLHSDGPQEDFRLLDIMSSTVCYRAQL